MVQSHLWVKGRASLPTGPKTPAVAKLIADFDRRQAWGHEGVMSCTHWLNWKCGISLGAAREKARRKLFNIIHGRTLKAG